MFSVGAVRFEKHGTGHVLAVVVLLDEGKERDSRGPRFGSRPLVEGVQGCVGSLAP